jgi:CubicO group peptidase (beta-lactamase class C family)
LKSWNATRLAAAVFVLVALGPAPGVRADSFALLLFEQYLEALRVQARIPGMSAAIVQEGEVVWERGFGFQDVENGVRAAPDTPYPLNDLSQTFAALLLLQCVERGRLDLDARVTDFVPAFPAGAASVAHVLSHTSDATPPGSAFKYDPARFNQLTGVAEACSGSTYRRLLATSLLEKLALTDSVPGHDLETPDALNLPEGLFTRAELERYAAVLARVARPYRVDRNGRPVRSEYPPKEIGAAGGVISSVRDLARLDAALDRDNDPEFPDELLLQRETLDLAWQAVPSADGRIPTGLGWFVQIHNGRRIVWHFGIMRDGFSSLVVKLPDRRITLILLANSDGLSAPFPLAEGDVTTSFFARVFLRIFG